ncbi:N-6 DNA methylase [Zobellella denitrificans]
MFLNQFYTQQLYGDLLVNNLCIKNPCHAIDLGFGAGDLLYAAQRRWKKINLIGVDIDERNVINANFSNKIKAIHHDGFCPNLPFFIKEKYGEMDLLISNPPYYQKKIDRNILKILKESGVHECISKNSKTISAEVVFLAQNLRLINTKNELGIILPSGIISGEKGAPIREFLLSEFDIRKIIQLPTNSFKNTDAQTFILTLGHKKNKSQKGIEVYHSDKENPIKISATEAIQRCDYTYYKRKNQHSSKLKPKDLDFEVMRGKKTYRELKISTTEFIHTTKLTNNPIVLDLPFMPTKDNLNAIKGDILLARVGKRCIGRVAFVRSGSLPVSDCIIIIRPNTPTASKEIWNRISSKTAREALYDLSLGVGAKYLTYKITREFLTNVPGSS